MINILPPSQKKLVRRIRIMRVVAAYLGSVIVLAVVAVVLLLPTYVSIRSREMALRSHTRALEANGVMVSAADIAALEARTKRMREKLTAKVPASPLVFVQIVGEVTVPGVKLVGFDIPNPEKNTAQIRGTASTREALQQFIGALQKDARIATVDSPITNFVKSSESEFTLTLTFVQP